MELLYNMGRAALPFVDYEHVVLSVVGNQSVILGCLLRLKCHMVVVDRFVVDLGCLKRLSVFTILYAR